MKDKDKPHYIHDMKPSEIGEVIEETEWEAADGETPIDEYSALNPGSLIQQVYRQHYSGLLLMHGQGMEIANANWPLAYGN